MLHATDRKHPAPIPGGGDGLPLAGFIRAAQLVPHIIPIGRVTLWRWVKAGTFPKPAKLGPAVTAWPVAAVREWMEARR